MLSCLRGERWEFEGKALISVPECREPSKGERLGFGAKPHQPCACGKLAQTAVLLGVKGNIPLRTVFGSAKKGVALL